MQAAPIYPGLPLTGAMRVKHPSNQAPMQRPGLLVGESLLVRGRGALAALQCWPGHFAGLGKVCALVCGAGTDGIEA